MTDWLGTFLAICAHRGDQLYQPQPVWVWSRDGSQVVWANPVAAGLLGVDSLDELSALKLPEENNLRRDIVNITRALVRGGTLSRLRFFRGARSMPLACRCERLRLPDGRTFTLIAAVDAIDRQSEVSDSQLARFMAEGGRSTVVLGRNGEVLAHRGEVAEIGDFANMAGQDGLQTDELIVGDQAAPVRSVAAARMGEPRILLWVDSVPEPSAGPVPAGEAETVATDETREPSEPEIAVAPEPNQAEIPEALPREEIHDDDIGQQARLLRSALRGSSGAGENTISEAWPDAVDTLPKKPVRFLWQTDADDRFLFVSPGLEQLVGRSSQIVGERWDDIADRMKLDPVGRVSQALAARDTWSGFTAWWPTDDGSARIPAELTALPVFAVDQSFQGYRGFGVLKPAEALSAVAFDRRFPGGSRNDQADIAQSRTRRTGSAQSDPERPANVVPIREDLKRLPDFARLSPQERSAFDEIALALKTHDEVAHLYAEAGAISAPAADQDSGEIIDGGEPVTEFPGNGADGSPAEEAAEQQPPADSDYSTDPDDPDFLASLPDGDDDSPPDIDETYSEEFDALVLSEDDQPDVKDVASLPEGEEYPTDAAVDPGDTEQPAEFVAPAPANDDDSAVSSDAPAGAGQHTIAELETVLNIAADGVVIVDESGSIASLNASAQALFGQPAENVIGKPFVELLCEDSRQSALDYLDGLRENGVAAVLSAGREFFALTGNGTIPLFMTIGRMGGGDDDGRYCAVMRDISQWKHTEAELIAGRKAAEQASEQKSEFLARVSHEIRTPLNAIIGFAEVMIEERFGPVENERYREYLRDIRTSGEHVVSLVNDLLDISKIEAGKLDLTFSAVPLNELVRECVALMQPQANRAKVIVRSSLAGELPSIVADPRTMRQVVLNLLSNSIKFTGSGGQVIVSTTLMETGEAVLRIRDTGAGMSEEDLARALEPFRQLSTSRIGDENGTGLGLPLTKALVEANRAAFTISSAKGEGTIVQATFPPTRVLSE